MSKPRDYERVIKTLNQAYEALGKIILDDPIDNNDGRMRLMRDMSEYADYLQSATWWREPKKGKR